MKSKTKWIAGLRRAVIFGAIVSSGLQTASATAEKFRGAVWVGAPCFSRGEMDFSPSEKRSISKWALALEFPEASAKAPDQSRDILRSAESLLPPHECGGSHREEDLASCSLFFSATASSVAQSSAPKAPRASVSPQTAALERDFFAAIRTGDAGKFLSYVPEEGIHVGPQAQPVGRAEVEAQLSHRRGLYCKLFDSSCIDTPVKLDASSRACSDRELLTHSEKVRTAASETVRNGVRQAILVAEVKNKRCGGAMLIDFIFNYQQGEWKLFSAP